MSDVRRSKSYVWCPMSTVRCMMSDVRCPNSDVRSPISMCDVKSEKKTDKKRAKRSTKIRTKNRTKDRTKKKRNDRTKKWDEKTEHYIVAWEYEFYLRGWKYLILMFLFQKVKILMEKRKIMLVTMATPISSHVEIKIVSSLRAMKIWFFSKRKNPGISSVSI